ncbi:MAG: NAD(P)(+) transhydrogenase (Re/Si-specific) subunit beta, partial [Alphaproteobacteria bacterium]|nr:NAD(P)(+) transhydrogenase (Re/Si-specific) subunit beta [Alphaproteobacteria bacterium]
MQNLIQILIYSFFIISIFSLSSPKIAYRGNLLAISSMSILLITYYIKLPAHKLIIALIPLTLGAIISIYFSSKIKLKNLPQMIALLNGFGGLSSGLIGLTALFIKNLSSHLLIFIIILGFITFFGSIASYIRLNYTFSPVHPKLYKTISVISLVLIFLILNFYPLTTEKSLIAIVLLSSILGYSFILPIGGADMPIIISMLNSFSGWTTLLIGLITTNILLIITGTLIGSSGTILSYIMLKSMHKRLLDILFSPPTPNSSGSSLSKINQASPSDVAFLLENASNIIIVPGFGLASSNAEHELKTLTDILTSMYSVNIKFAIHPVAGRMPGHLNILLAEASIPENLIYELKDINKDFKTTDIALVIGANDITNPLAKTDSSSPIYQMPILEVEEAKKIIIIKRSLSQGYSAIDNPLFYISSPTDGKRHRRKPNRMS